MSLIINVVGVVLLIVLGWRQPTLDYACSEEVNAIGIASLQHSQWRTHSLECWHNAYGVAKLKNTKLACIARETANGKLRFYFPFNTFLSPTASRTTISFSRTKIRFECSKSLSVRISELFCTPNLSASCFLDNLNGTIFECKASTLWSRNETIFSLMEAI